MNPTREQFEMSARAIGESVVTTEAEMHGCLPESTIYTGVMLDGIQDAWQPHIPGTDNAMLAAGLKIDQEWTNAYAWAGGNGLAGRRRNYSDFQGTETERRARAMAFAVFLVAVEIGRTMKENQDA